MNTEDKNKEQAILEAAEHTFLEHGFEASKTTQIAARAGVTHAMLHYYYRTKENLFNMVFDKKLQLLKESLFALAGNQEMPFLERIRIGVGAHFDFISKHPHLPRFVINELLFKPERLKMVEAIVRKSAGTLIGEIQHAIDGDVERGAIRPVEATTLLLDIASLNVFLFVALPLLHIFAIPQGMSEQEFLEMRKRENVEVIMCRLKKQPHSEP
ncbi:MAG: TetR/AcrR family transcriptional regulator [Tannerella sp.]|jgi:AcrR family transcriptional regulator|nr:TetR/AcrR family transcriptional regulator [Tannerella sp.]